MDFTPRGNQGITPPTPVRRSVPVSGSGATSAAPAAVSGASARMAARSSAAQPATTQPAATPSKAPRPRLSSTLSGTARRAVNSVARKKTTNFRAGAYGAFTAAGSPKNGAAYGVATPVRPEAPLGMPVDASDYSEITDFTEPVTPEPAPKHRISTRGPRLLTKTRAHRAVASASSAPAPAAPGPASASVSPRRAAAPRATSKPQSVTDPTDFSDLGRLAQEIAEIEDGPDFIETATELEIKPAPRPKAVTPIPRRRTAAAAARPGATPAPTQPTRPAAPAQSSSIPVTSYNASTPAPQIPQTSVSTRISAARSSFSITSSEQPFTLNSDPHFGVVENFQPKFLKTEVEKRPLSSSAPADTSTKATKPVSKTADLAAKSQMRIPHPQFGGTSRLKRRSTAAKNPYPPNPALSRAAEAVAPETKSPVKVVKDTKKSNKIGAFLAVLGTIVLGAAVGTIAFLLLPR